MLVWTVANQKGGVGKTTTTVALGGLAAEQGLRVLLLDLDPHGSLSSYFRQDPDTQEKSAFNLFDPTEVNIKERIESIVINTGYENLDIIPAATALATLERQRVSQDGLGLVVSRALVKVADDYDLVLIDTPPLLGVLLINALAACQHLIIPVQTEFLALKGLERMVGTLKMMSRSRRQALEYTIVPVMYDRRTKASIATLRTIRNTYAETEWPGKIPVDTQFRNASGEGVPPHIYNAKSHGVEAYRSLYKWLMLKAQKVTNVDDEDRVQT